MPKKRHSSDDSLGVGTYSRSVVLFLKYPRPGEVKTRLARGVGGDVACALYRLLLQRTLSEVHQVETSLTAYYSPKKDRAAFQRLISSVSTWLPQNGDDLGLRMAHALQSELKRGVDQVLLIGSDAVTLKANLLKQAFVALKSKDIVLGPTLDGGFYLIGVRRSVLDIKHDALLQLFQNMTWSHERVYEHMIQRIKRSGLSVHHSPRGVDLDACNQLKPALLDQIFPMV